VARQDLGRRDSVQVRDLFDEDHLGAVDGSLLRDLLPHGCMLLLLSPVPVK